MTDFSDSSDVNPEEMARMVEDLDDLENTLLGGSLKKQEQFSTNKDKDTTEVKKKVAFKDFNNDDPLADLLSDDENSYETRKPIRANTKSNLVADLFGIKNPKPLEKQVEEIKPRKVDEPRVNVAKEITISAENLAIPVTKKPPATMSTQSRSNPQNIPEKLSANDETGRIEDSQKLPNTRARKSSLMEDLFGTRSRSAPTKEIETRPNIPKSVSPNPSSLFEHPKFEESSKSSIGYSLDSGVHREPRRGRRNSPIISDPLGLFSVPEKSVEKAQSASDVEKKIETRVDDKMPDENLPEWLGGKTRENKYENEKPASLYSGKTCDEPTTMLSSVTSVADTRESNNANETTTGLSSQTNRETTIFYPNMSTLMGTQFDQQAAIIAMQQQEHELKTAAILSRQNEQVAKIVENQRAKLDEQGKMFNALIKHQIDRQSMLETQMKIQQARIDHYIQTLMSQPTSLPNGVYPEEKSTNEIDKEKDKSESPESMIKKLQLEIVYLENTVEILKDKHEKEITIIQESHEKQMLFLREGMEKLEKKMYQDSEALETEYERKIVRLKEDNEKLEDTCREEIERLKKNEKTLIDEISFRHSQNVELLQKEHAATIDEISRAKEIERQAVETMTSHKTDLDDLLQRSQIVFSNFQNLQKKLEHKDEEFDETRVTYLMKQEENLQLLRDQLNLQQESLADERKRLMEISQKLDTAAAELIVEFKKNNLSINDKEERLATRERTLVREKDLFDEQMRWEREHLQVTKEAWIKEQERQMQLIHNERQAVANERGKSEVFNRLKNGSDDMAKIELEAALKTAQEAANEANQARQKWQEKCRALDSEKRLLREKEKDLVNRAKELENLTESALAKRDEGVQALKEANRLEQRHKEHLGQLQMQLEILAHREKKKATEKLALARERLAARICPAEKPEKDTAEHILPIHNERSFATNSHVSTHFKDVVDPHLLLLKLNLDNKLDTTDELLAAMQVTGQ